MKKPILYELFRRREYNKQIGILKDPFSHDKIEKVVFVVGKSMMGNKMCYATVYFRNGNTKGEQEVEAETFPDLVRAVEEFLKTL